MEVTWQWKRIVFFSGGTGNGFFLAQTLPVYSLFTGKIGTNARRRIKKPYMPPRTTPRRRRWMKEAQAAASEV